MASKTLLTIFFSRSDADTQMISNICEFLMVKRFGDDSLRFAYLIQFAPNVYCADSNLVEDVILNVVRCYTHTLTHPLVIEQIRHTLINITYSFLIHSLAGNCMFAS